MNILVSILLINMTSYSWNKNDMKVLLSATKKCKIRYKSELHKFIKKGKRNYYAICK